MAIKGYTFYIDGVKVNQVPQESPTYTFTGLASSSVHDITVEAVDYAGNVSTPGELDGASTLTYTSGSPMSDADKLAIDNIVNTSLAANGAAKNFTANNAGVIISITSDKGDYAKAYGKDYGGNILTTDMKMRWGSNTKMATATLILAQIDAGHISFDDTLTKFGSRTSGVANGNTITIKHLLMMRSGIRDYLQQDGTVQKSYFLNPTQTFDPMPYIRSYTPLFAPNERTEYSNSNYYLMGRILEWCDATYGTGRDIRTIMLEDFCEAFGLTETEWPTGNNMTAPYSRAGAANAPDILSAMQSLGIFSFLIPWVVPGAQLTPTIEFTAVSPSWAGSAGVLDGTIDDLLTFGKGLRDGLLISPALQQLRKELFETYLTYPPDPAHPEIGDGWSGAGLGFFQFGQWLGWVGSFAGYMSVVFFNPVNDAVIAAMANWMEYNVSDLFMKLRYYLYPESVHTQPSIRRLDSGVASGEAFGTPGVYVYHAPGDEDTNTDVPLKVPFYV